MDIPFINQSKPKTTTFVPETSVELQDMLFKSTNSSNDIPKAYMEEYEIEAYFWWKQAWELLEKAGVDFEEAKSYLENTANSMVNLTRGRQGMNVVTILGRPQIPKRTSQGYAESKNNLVPVRPVQSQQPPISEQQYQ